MDDWIALGDVTVGIVDRLRRERGRAAFARQGGGMWPLGGNEADGFCEFAGAMNAPRQGDAGGSDVDARGRISSVMTVPAVSRGTRKGLPSRTVEIQCEDRVEDVRVLVVARPSNDNVPIAKRGAAERWRN